MCANVKGYKLSYNDVGWLLAVVNHLSTKKFAWVPKNKLTLTIDDVRNKILNGNFDNYLLPLVYRYEFNGFSGELSLILSYIQDYKDRTTLDFLTAINPDNYFEINKTDILKSSIDFHCSSLIDYLLNKYKNSDWTEDFLKKLFG